MNNYVKSYMKNGMHCFRYWWLASTLVYCLGVMFGKVWVGACFAQWEQAAMQLQLQVALQPPTWHSARLA